MDELLPCPFCGSKDVDVDLNDRAYCDACGAQGGECSAETEARALWNTRAAQPAPVVLTEEEMEARWRAWLQRKNRLDRIAALRTPQGRDAHDEEERAAAIAHHERVIAELERFALTGVR